eukprot:TRINITY_DN10288_c0_g1_i1.p1 TRINITY_DN10288_c0_g1~~TRINITY_DN10288_c0_g1_i1.p1  ORF type:complete len:284 (+),score=54.16 TRINITY_DN10288_c0_g1_i1:3-854(+)
MEESVAWKQWYQRRVRESKTESERLLPIHEQEIRLKTWQFCSLVSLVSLFFVSAVVFFSLFLSLYFSSKPSSSPQPAPTPPSGVCTGGMTVISQTSTWPVPQSGCVVTVYLWGAGGGGGSSNNWEESLTNPGAGGGSGAYSYLTFEPKQGSVLSFTIGAGGAGGPVPGWKAAGSDGSTGGESVVEYETKEKILGANGGQGGGGSNYNYNGKGGEGGQSSLLGSSFPGNKGQDGDAGGSGGRMNTVTIGERTLGFGEGGMGGRYPFASEAGKDGGNGGAIIVWK